MRVSADPFIKVKKLIQDLIERLVTEAAEEATKKGWCDTEMGKATHTRDSNMNKIMELNANLEELEATKAKLEEEIATLTTEISELNDSLTKQTNQTVFKSANGTSKGGHVVAEGDGDEALEEEGDDVAWLKDPGAYDDLDDWLPEGTEDIPNIFHVVFLANVRTEWRYYYFVHIHSILTTQD